MLPSSREIILHAAISRMNLANDNTLHVIDNNCNLHQIDLKSLSISKSVSLAQIYEQNDFDYYKRPFALGKNKAYISFSKQGWEYVLNISQRLNKASSFLYNGGNASVTKAFFSEDDELLITGNEKGRTYVISADEGYIKAELPRSSDTITAVTISNEYKLAARASFTKNLVVYRIDSMKVVFKMKLPSVIERIRFLDQETLLIITRDGKILKIDFENEKILQEKIVCENMWPSSMTLSHSKKFVYVSTRESMLYALHVNSLDTLFQLKLPYHGITAMVRSPQYFIIGFKTGEIIFYNHREFENEFLSAIQLKNIKEASILFQKNTFLMSNRATKIIYDYWLEEKETITNLLSRGEIEKARTIAEPYLFHPKCQLEFAELELLQPELVALQRYIRSMSYAAAYELIAQRPALRKSTLYTSLDAIWKKALQKAQTLLSREPMANKEAAKDSLKLFWNIEEKQPIIDHMLLHSGIFTMAESCIRDKNFALYFKIAATNTFLEHTPLYHKVLNLGEKLQQQIITHIENKDYEHALSYSDMLSTFTPYFHQAQRLSEVSKALMLVEHHISNNNLLEAVKLQEKYDLQTNYSLIHTLEDMKSTFQKQQFLLLESHQYSQILTNLSPYMKISLCAGLIATIMKRFYITQFKDAHKRCNEAIDWEKTFEIYLNLFTMDKWLVEFAKESEKTHILKNFQQNNEILPCTNYPKNILVTKTNAL
ncbi:MAG: hypothetical protein PHN18_01030 [Sulfurospirillaceae bacterium]|nr:hypothetical protein [Sulfurospirillaceae bacterium]MDD2826078.1 hypothetical protein [Sulfurospirillaceae bacterium]